MSHWLFSFFLCRRSMSSIGNSNVSSLVQVDVSCQLLPLLLGRPTTTSLRFGGVTSKNNDTCEREGQRSSLVRAVCRVIQHRMVAAATYGLCLQPVLWHSAFGFSHSRQRVCCCCLGSNIILSSHNHRLSVVQPWRGQPSDPVRETVSRQNLLLTQLPSFLLNYINRFRLNVQDRSSSH